jgi:hypothetical protein
MLSDKCQRAREKKKKKGPYYGRSFTVAYVGTLQSAGITASSSLCSFFITPGVLRAQNRML